MKKCVVLLSLLFIGVSVFAGNQRTFKGIYYGPKDAGGYQAEQCKLDLYLPPEKFKNFPVLIYFHGGGLTGGRRGGPRGVIKKGVALLAPSYRLYPKAKCPDYLTDAAAAVAWTFKNIKKYGGNPDKIFVSGMSAGSYLAAMLGMDKSWLKAHDVDIDKIAGLIPVSGHMITHFTVRKEKGIKSTCGLSDEFSPLYHVRKTPFPIFIQCGDNDYPSRQEENKLFVSMMKRYARQPANKIIYQEYPGTHGSFFGPVPQADLLQFILETSGMAEKTGKFSGHYVPEAEVKATSRSVGDKTYVEFESSLVLPKAEVTLDVAGTKHCMKESNNIVVDKNDDLKSVEVTFKQKLPLKTINNTAEYKLPNKAGEALELKLKKGSTLKMWLSNDMLNLELDAKDKEITAAANDNLWSGDALEFFVDRSPFAGLNKNAFPVKGENVEVRQYIFAVAPAPSGKKVMLLKNRAKGKTKAQTSVEKTADGYKLKVEIPYEEISPLDKSSNTIGMSFQRCLKDPAKGSVGKEYFNSTRPSHMERFHYSLFKLD